MIEMVVNIYNLENKYENILKTLKFLLCFILQ